MSNNDTPEVLSALGMPPVVVYYPCADCLHSHAIHQDGGACRMDGCECQAYAGALPDGTPMAVRMRQLANVEWSTISPERSLPILLGAVKLDTLTEEKQLEHYNWMRDVARRAVTHLRYWNGSKAVWRNCKVVPSDQVPNHEAWEISIDELDRGGCRLLVALVGALVADLNDGGPFGGVVRPFRTRRAAAVPPAGGDLPPHPTRAGAEQVGRAR